MDQETFDELIAAAKKAGFPNPEKYADAIKEAKARFGTLDIVDYLDKEVRGRIDDKSYSYLLRAATICNPPVGVVVARMTEVVGILARPNLEIDPERFGETSNCESDLFSRVLTAFCGSVIEDVSVGAWIDVFIIVGIDYFIEVV